tara:strand:- start:839 stop:2326 length:1488 start_codon:yes stop_codon:yes gene_type:complete
LRQILPIFLVLFSITLITKGQNKIEILHADDLIFNNKIHPEYGKLIGNVSFKLEETLMTCDSAYHYKYNKIDAFGSIIINKGDTLWLYGEKLNLNENTRKAVISKNVKLIDKHTILTTELITYDIGAGIANYPFKGKITDEKNNLVSNSGSYNTKSHIFYFKGDIELTNNEYVMKTDTMLYNSKSNISFFHGPTSIKSDNNIIYCEDGWYDSKNNTSQFQKNGSINNKNFSLSGDSLFYDRNIGYGRAISNVFLIDTTNNLFITGKIAEYFEDSEKVVVTNSPLLNIITYDDTLFIYADTMMSTKVESKREIVAYNNVKCFKNNLQAISDSLSYNTKDSTIELFYQPIIWSNKYQITSDSIKIQLNNGQISKMFLRSNPMIISQEDSINFNQIKGKVMYGFFKNNNLHKISVIGGGQTIFLAKNSENKNIGINTSECSDISLIFKDNLIDVISFHNQPAAIFHPLNKIKEEKRKLNGFLWRENNRPKGKFDLFNE